MRNASGVRWLLSVSLATLFCAPLPAAELPEGNSFTNSIGMRFVRLEGGTYRRGREDTPVLRLLSQRGAGVVSPDEGRWTVPTIVDHLAEIAGIEAEAVVA